MDERVHFVHVRVEFKSEASPIEILQLLTLFRQHTATGPLQQIDLALLDVTVVEAANATEQVAELNQRHQSGVVARLFGRVMQRYDFNQVAGEFPALGQQAPTFTVSESQNALLRFVERNTFRAPKLESRSKLLGQNPEVDDDAKIVKQAGEIGDWPVWVATPAGRIAGRVCGVRKSELAIEKAQRKLTRKQQQGKGRVTEETRQLACYVLVFTTLSVQEVPAWQVLKGYRLRWQIELTFKRLKSIVQMGHVPKQDDQSSRAWLYGKLLVALLSQKLARVGSVLSPWGYYLPQETALAEPLA